MRARLPAACTGMLPCTSAAAASSARAMRRATARSNRWASKTAAPSASKTGRRDSRMGSAFKCGLRGMERTLTPSAFVPYRSGVIRRLGARCLATPLGGRFSTRPAGDGPADMGRPYSSACAPSHHRLPPPGPARTGNVRSVRPPGQAPAASPARPRAGRLAGGSGGGDGPGGSCGGSPATRVLQRLRVAMRLRHRSLRTEAAGLPPEWRAPPGHPGGRCGAWPGRQADAVQQSILSQGHDRTAVRAPP